MTPTEEVTNDFAETYSNGTLEGLHAGGALHRNISQGQVRLRDIRYRIPKRVRDGGQL